MAKKLVDGRKPGSGKGVVSDKRKSYEGIGKVYGLYDSSIKNPTEKDVVYIGSCFQSKAQRIATTVYQSRTINKTKLHKWVNELNEQPSMMILETISGTSRTELREREDWWLNNLKPKLNIRSSIKISYKKKDRTNFIQNLTKLSKENLTQECIAKELGFSESMINYWMKKLNLKK